MSGEVLSLRWNNHQSAFLDVLSSLCFKDTLSDVTLTCDGNFFAAHKLVLSVCSEYFETVFDHVKEKHPIVVMGNMHAEDLKALLTFMYEGEVSISHSRLGNVMKAADFLKIKGLISNERSIKTAYSTDYTSRVDETESDPSMNSTQNMNKVNCSDHSVNYKEQSDYSHASYNESLDIPDESDGDFDSSFQHAKNESITAIKENYENNKHNDSISNSKHCNAVSDEPIKAETFDFFEDEQFQRSYVPTNMMTADYTFKHQHPSNFAMEAPLTILDSLTAAKSSKSPDHTNLRLADSSTLRTKETDSPDRGYNTSLLEDLGEKNIDMLRTPIDKIFSCPFCPYRCTTKSNLKCHIRRHTGEKPFGCQFYSYRSAQSSNIKIHVLRMHKDVSSNRIVATGVRSVYNESTNIGSANYDFRNFPHMQEEPNFLEMCEPTIKIEPGVSLEALQPSMIRDQHNVYNMAAQNEAME